MTRKTSRTSKTGDHRKETQQSERNLSILIPNFSVDGRGNQKDTANSSYKTKRNGNLLDSKSNNTKLTEKKAAIKTRKDCVPLNSPGRKEKNNDEEKNSWRWEKTFDTGCEGTEENRTGCLRRIGNDIAATQECYGQKRSLRDGLKNTT